MSDQPQQLVVGSDHVQTIERNGLGRGRLTRPTPERVPGRPQHAVPTGTTTAVCGHQPARVWPEYPWSGRLGSIDDLCPDCYEIAGA